MATPRAMSNWVFRAAAVVLAFAYDGSPLEAQEHVDLGDIVAGGDGTGTGGGDQGSREFTGVNIDTGLFMTEAEISGFWTETVDTDGVNPSPVEDSEFINSVFFITEPEIPINLEGVSFTFDEGDANGSSYNHVLSNFTHQLEDGFRGIDAGAREWQSAVSIHGAAGITFDLDALRSRFGADRISKFATFAGNVDCDCAFTNIYIVYSSSEGIVKDPAATDPDGVFRLREVGSDAGGFYFSEIPAAASFLTLATGTFDDDNCCDGSVFANPRIYPSDVQPGACAELVANPAELFIATGTTQQLKITCVDEKLVQADVTSTVTYTPEPAGSITVDANGLVTAVKPGFTELTVALGALETVIEATVADAGVCQDLSVTPGRVLVRPSGTAQLSVSCTDGFGQTLDKTAGAGGTTYAVEPAGVVTVSGDGLITALPAGGKALVTVTNGEFSRSLHVNVFDYIDIADLVAFGDGTGTGGGDAGDREFTAIDVDTGEPLTEDDAIAAMADAFELDGVNPSPVDASDFVDQVFFITEETMPINSEGGTFSWQPEDVVSAGFGPILSNFTHGLADDDRGIEVAFRRDWSSAVGIHASTGITFDLGALREEFGAEAIHKVGLFAGRSCTGQVGSGSANVYVIFSNADGVVEDPDAGGGLPYFMRFILENDGETYLTAIPADAAYLTLAVGSDGAIGCDHGVFANAVIIPDVALSCDSLAITPSDSTLQSGGSLQLEVECINELGLPTQVTAGAQGTQYKADSTVVSVSPDGLVTAQVSGQAKVTATNGAATATAVIRVADFIDLGDLVAGGDGKGSGGGDRGDRDFTAVNIDTGVFMTEAEILMTFNLGSDIDGINPSPVADSEYIDSVFYMNDDTTAINLSNTVFDWEDGDPDPGAWSHIYSNFTHRLEAGERIISAGGRTDWETAVGIHAASGITFNLDALREKYGEQAVHTFSTFAGMGPGDCGDSTAKFYVIYSNEDGVVPDPVAPAGQDYWSMHVPIEWISEYRGTIPAEASFLTLATGSGGDSVFCDFGTFAEARIFSAAAGGRQFVRADANADGAVDITDPIFILGYLFLGQTTPPCIKAADADDTGEVDLTDGIYVLSQLFTGGPLPPPPFPQCGADPTTDSLTCEEFTRCGG